MGVYVLSSGTFGDRAVEGLSISGGALALAPISRTVSFYELLISRMRHRGRRSVFRQESQGGGVKRTLTRSRSPSPAAIHMFFAFMVLVETGMTGDGKFAVAFLGRDAWEGDQMPPTWDCLFGEGWKELQLLGGITLFAPTHFSGHRRAVHDTPCRERSVVDC